MPAPPSPEKAEVANCRGQSRTHLVLPRSVPARRSDWVAGPDTATMTFTVQRLPVTGLRCACAVLAQLVADYPDGSALFIAIFPVEHPR
jgi:hypothetical protein